MAKILKNQTAGAISLDIGLTVPASGQLTLSSSDYEEAAGSDDIITHIGTGDIIVNDGSVDLSKSQASALIQGAFPTSLKIKGDGGESPEVIDNGDGIMRLALDIGDVSGPEGPQGPAGATGPQGPAGPGQYYAYDSSESTSSTTSGNWQNKLTLTDTFTAGYYIVEWAFETYTTDYDLDVRVQVDGSDINEFQNGTTKTWVANSGFQRIYLSGSTDIDIDYNDAGGGTASIRRARLLVRGGE